MLYFGDLCACRLEVGIWPYILHSKSALNYNVKTYNCVAKEFYSYLANKYKTEIPHVSLKNENFTVFKFMYL